MPDIAELLTYYVITALLIIGAPGVFFFIVFMPSFKILRDVWLGTRITKCMVIPQSTK